MARFEVRREKQLVGSLDTQQAQLIVKVETKPLVQDLFTHPRTSHIGYYIYRTDDGCLVRLEERGEISLGPAKLISPSEAVDLCRSNGCDVPPFLEAGGQRQEKHNAVPHTQSPETDDKPTADFTEHDLTALRQIKSAVYGVAGGFGEEECIEELGFAIAALSAFSGRVDADTIRSARHVTCQSSNVLCNAAEAILAGCDVVGLGQYFRRVSDAYSWFEKEEISPLIALSFGASFDPAYDFDFVSVRNRAPKTTIQAGVRKLLGFKLTRDRHTAIWCLMRMGLAMSQTARDVCGQHLFDLPFPPNIVAEFRADRPSDGDNYSGNGEDTAFPPVAEVAVSIPPRRRNGTFFRDFQWMSWHRIEGLREGEIRDRWNSLTNEERLSVGQNAKAAAAIAEGRTGWDLVNKGVAKAADELASFVRTQSETSTNTEVSDGF